MIQFFTNPTEKMKYKGRQPITLPAILHRELILAQIPFQTYLDFLKLREIAQNRTPWRHIVNQIITQITIQCFQDIEATTIATRAQRQKRNTETATLNYTDETRRRKKIRLTLGRTPPLRLPAQRPRDPTIADEQGMERLAYRRRLNAQEIDIHNRRNI